MGTGRCTVSTGCGGPSSAECTYTDSINPVNDGCDATATILRTWSSPGVSPVTQTITVTDSGVRATVTAPNDVTISCVESSDPANTGTATAIDDCSVPSVTFVDSITNNCDEDTCSNTETITRTWTADDGCNNNPLDTDVQTITRTSCDVGPVTCPDPIVIDDDDVCNCRAASSSDAYTISANFLFVATIAFFV